MYAIFSLGGHQYKAEPDSEITVFRLSEEEGETIEISDILLVSDEDELLIGQPYVENATVKAQVDEHFRGDKITVYNYKRRKGQRRKLGHRDDLTRIKIESIAV
ncbi:MAG: 50S ribosomal protein L21 [bacterium]